MLLMEKICTVDGCTLPRKSRWKCVEHRKAWWSKKSACRVTGCTRLARAQSMCGTHYERVRTGGEIGDPRIGRFGARHPRWNGDQVTYYGLHARIRAARGQARYQTCSCGKPAAQWAYDYSDPTELIDDASGMRYSLDIQRYVAMCASCHKVHDINWQR